jgi:hypothetical protein
MTTKTRFLLALAALGGLFIGCYQGEFLAGQPCTEDHDCGLVLSCNAGICGDYPPDVPVLELSLSPIKQFEFDWAPAIGTNDYQLFERVDADATYVQIGEDMVELGTSLTVPLHFRANASYKLVACNDSGCSESEAVDVEGSLAEAVGYFKPFDAASLDDHFGSDVALSGDGNTLAVGGGFLPPDDDVAFDDIDFGAVYVYVQNDQAQWTQQARIEDPDTDEFEDAFGRSVALSEDGSTLTVGAPLTFGSGAAWVFVRDDQATWTQQAYIEAPEPVEGLRFGSSVALSGSGDMLAIAADPHIDSEDPPLGSVHLFTRDDQAQWTQQASLTASDAGIYSNDFGSSLALSADGSTLAVGDARESGGATGIDGDPAGVFYSGSGAVYVFVHDAQSWKRQAYIKASNADAGDHFGWDVALSGDGHTLAVTALDEESGAIGIDGEQDDDSAPRAGAAYVFVRDDQAEWMQQAYVKASNTNGGLLYYEGVDGDRFGHGVALSGDGNILAVAAPGEAGGAIGIDGDQSSNSDQGAGAVYMFVRDDQTQWTQRAYVKAPNTDMGDAFGFDVALSEDGDTVAVVAKGEDSNATGINGDTADNSVSNAGAVYVY